MRKSKGKDDAFRLGVIDEYLSGASKYSLLKKYKLRSSRSISEWMLKFGIENTRKGEMPPSLMKAKEREEETPADVKALQAEVKKLKRDLAYERMKSDAYDTLINLAEEQLHISIKKK